MAAAGIAYFLTAARDIVVGDTPELAAVALTLGVAHPPGYPLLTLVGHTFGYLPIDPQPFRVNLVSVVAHTATVGIVYLTAPRVSGQAVASALAALVLAFNPLFWSWPLALERFPLNDLLAAGDGEPPPGGRGVPRPYRAGVKGTIHGRSSTRGTPLATTTRLVTAEELERLPSDFRCELIDGEVVELMPPGGVHGVIAATVARILGIHISAHRLGVVVVETGFILRRNPDTVRSPDVGFVRADRIPLDGVPRGFWELAPDLAVEVVSPGDTPSEIRAKVRDWIEGGARLVWVVYPDSRTVQVVRSLQERFTLTVDDTIDGGDVLPGFACPVAELFG